MSYNNFIHTDGTRKTVSEEYPLPTKQTERVNLDVQTVCLLQDILTELKINNRYLAEFLGDSIASEDL